jgi:hypothetical protein
MKTIKYFFASVYQSIKSRRPSGTPYFNLSLGITGILLLNIVDLLLILKIWLHINLITETKSTFITCFISLAILIIFLIRMIMPFDELNDIDVDQSDIKRNNFLFFLYGMLSVALMVILLILSRKHY